METWNRLTAVGGEEGGEFDWGGLEGWGENADNYN